MPRLSLHLTDENLATLRARAREEGISLSDHVGNLIENDAANHRWPEGFWSLYGAIDSSGFSTPEDFPPANDTEFEKLFA